MTKPKWLRAANTALLTMAVLSGCADQHAMTDEKITSQVKKAIAQHSDLGPPNRIYVETRNGTVYLTGTAYHPLAANNAQELAREVPGVSDVVTNISVQPN